MPRYSVLHNEVASCSCGANYNMIQTTTPPKSDSSQVVRMASIQGQNLPGDLPSFSTKMRTMQFFFQPKSRYAPAFSTKHKPIIAINSLYLHWTASTNQMPLQRKWTHPNEPRRLPAWNVVWRYEDVWRTGLNPIHLQVFLGLYHVWWEWERFYYWGSHNLHRKAGSLEICVNNHV